MVFDVKLLRYKGRRISVDDRERVRQLHGHMFIGPELLGGVPVITARIHFYGNQTDPPMARLYEPAMHLMDGNSMMIHGFEKTEIDGVEATVMQVWECTVSPVIPPPRERKAKAPANVAVTA
jgi:hypothetical protein